MNITALEELQQEAHDEGIDLIYRHFCGDKKSMCYQIDDYKAIAINKSAIESSAEERVLLAEELRIYN